MVDVSDSIVLFPLDIHLSIRKYMYSNCIAYITVCRVLFYFMRFFPSHSYALQSRDGSYTGFIKVHFQLERPISLPPPQCQSSTQEEDQHPTRMKRRTSFYLPKDAAKHLHISSETRVHEVIEALLNKFTVVDNPAKFALFERTEKQSQGRNLHITLLVGQKNTQSTKFRSSDMFSFSVHT